MFPISENRIQIIITKGKRLIDSHNVVFFDVFDTLITRDCSKPTDVFELVEQTYNKAVKGSNLCNFCRMRQEAEKRSAKTVTAPNLDEIYDHLSLDAFQKIKLKDIEIDIERKLSVKKYTGYALYQYAKQQGKQIVAVSDMYLGSGIIREMLSAAGYSIDSVIVSCEYRAEKFNGKLFQIALDNISVSKKDIIHFGDNPVSDIIGAMRAGIDCLWIPARKNLSYFKKSGDSFADNYLLPFVANRVPLIGNKLTALGYETCGPMIVGFCQWLHQKLHEGEYQKALFCARDMLQTYQIYLRMFPEDKNLACYFYASRKSIQAAYEVVTGKAKTSDSIQQLAFLREYFQQLGCKGKVAFIDSGLNGRSQKMLTVVMQEKIEIHGLYMRVAKAFFNNVKDNNTLVYMYPDKPEVTHTIGSMFFENMLAATHGRTIGYTRDFDGKIEPLLGECHPNYALINDYQEGISFFAEDFMNSYFNNKIIEEKAVRNVLLCLSFFPRKEDVALLESLNCGEEKYGVPIIIKRKRWYYFQHVLGLFKDLKNTCWKGGYLRHRFPLAFPVIVRLYLFVDCLILNVIGEWNDERVPELGEDVNKESDSPLISIIVPVYNVEDYLAECINSLIQQTYHNLEIILVNDGSTDNSLKICKTFIALDKRIILISQKNQGLSSARNAGIKKMHGDFFTFVDSDDFLDKSFIEELYNAIISFNCDIAIGGTTFEWPSHKIKKEPSLTCLMPSVEIVKLFILKKDGIIQSAWGKLYNSKIAHVLKFPAGKLYEDQFVMYHIVLDNNCCIVNGPTYHYRQVRPGSILTNKSNIEKKVNDLWESLNNLKDLLENQSMNLIQYLNYKIAVDSLDIIRYCIIGSYDNLIYQYAMNEVKNSNLLKMLKLGLDLCTWLQMFMVKYMFPLYKFLLSQKYKA